MLAVMHVCTRCLFLDVESGSITKEMKNDVFRSLKKKERTCSITFSISPGRLGFVKKRPPTTTLAKM